MLYRTDSINLQQIIEACYGNATYVVPDLQREFVWNPEQIKLFIDSLFRGWPFGVLLIWEFRHNILNNQNNLTYRIPYRSFYTEVSRVIEEDAVYAQPAVPPHDYNMVLDGQ